MTAAALWLGPSHAEGRSAYARAREAGLSPLRALVVGSIASFRDCWAFRTKLAAHVGCSVRTVQRAITQAKAEGLLRTARAKPTEKPPNWDSPVPCGWSHRWTIGWGLAGRAVQDAIQVAKARWLVRVAVSSPPGPPETPALAGRGSSLRNAGVPGTGRGQPMIARRWTAEELDRELERLERKPPD